MIVVGPGFASRLLYSYGYNEATIYNMDMGYGSAVCLGLALAAEDERVIALEGDGSLLAGMSTLATIGRYQPSNLAVIALDNGIYESCGYDLETATSHGVNLSAIALACGWGHDRVVEARDVVSLKASIGRVLTEKGPWFVHVVIDPPDQDAASEPMTPGHDIVEASIGFRRSMMERGHV